MKQWKEIGKYGFLFLSASTLILFNRQLFSGGGRRRGREGSHEDAPISPSSEIQMIFLPAPPPLPLSPPGKVGCGVLIEKLELCYVPDTDS